jgi:hypothetical protein
MTRLSSRRIKGQNDKLVDSESNNVDRHKERTLAVTARAKDDDKCEGNGKKRKRDETDELDTNEDKDDSTNEEDATDQEWIPSASS